ncbi:hypothetical protein V8C35DRAFT_314674 [Trichoderma chlorosporum]
MAMQELKAAKARKDDAAARKRQRVQEELDELRQEDEDEAQERHENQQETAAEARRKTNSSLRTNRSIVVSSPSADSTDSSDIGSAESELSADVTTENGATENVGDRLDRKVQELKDALKAAQERKKSVAAAQRRARQARSTRQTQRDVQIPPNTMCDTSETPVKAVKRIQAELAAAEAERKAHYDKIKEELRELAKAHRESEEQRQREELRQQINETEGEISEVQQASGNKLQQSGQQSASYSSEDDFGDIYNAPRIQTPNTVNTQALGATIAAERPVSTAVAMPIADSNESQRPMPSFKAGGSSARQMAYGNKRPASPAANQGFANKRPKVALNLSSPTPRTNAEQQRNASGNQHLHLKVGADFRAKGSPTIIHSCCNKCRAKLKALVDKSNKLLTLIEGALTTAKSTKANIQLYVDDYKRSLAAAVGRNLPQEKL